MAAGSVSTKTFAFRAYFFLALFEGLLAFAWLFSIPSMPGKALLFQLSPLRLALAAAMLLPLVSFAGLATRAILDRSWLERSIARVNEFLLPGQRWFSLALALFFISSLLVGLFILWLQPKYHDYAWYSQAFARSTAPYESYLAIFERLVPVLLWFLALSGQTLALILVNYLPAARRAAPTLTHIFYRRFLVASIVTLACLHWAILALQLPVFTSIPGWYWDINPRELQPRTALILVFAVSFAVLLARVIRHPQRARSNLIALILFGYTWQAGFGFMEGQGFESIRLKYTNTYHRSYAVMVTERELGPIQVIRDYEILFGDRLFSSTKPPGVILTYLFTHKVVNFFDPQATYEGRYQALTAFIAFVFPLGSFVVLALIYLLVKRSLHPAVAILPCLLYLFMPNVILIPLFLDQVFYPLLFLLGVLVIRKAVASQSLGWGLFAGLFIYLAVFITFAMLPLLPLFIVWVSLDHLVNRRARSPLPALKLTVALGASFVVLLLAFRVFLNYDFFARYDHAMQVNIAFDFFERVGRPLPPEVAISGPSLSLAQRAAAARLNVIELAAATGFPIFLLFLSGGFRTMLAILKRKNTGMELMLAALFITFVAQVLFGPTQGEVTRLWLYWAPMVAIFAGIEIAALFEPEQRNPVLVLILFLQFLSVFLTFQFQDFVL